MSLTPQQWQNEMMHRGSTVNNYILQSLNFKYRTKLFFALVLHLVQKIDPVGV